MADNTTIHVRIKDPTLFSAGFVTTRMLRLPENSMICLKRLLQGMTIRIEFIKLKITLTISILGYIGPNFVWILVSNHISWICWQNVDMSTKMLTSTSGLTKSCYIDLRSSKCLEASDVNKNVDMSTFSPNRIHVNMQNDCETSIVVANSI